MTDLKDAYERINVISRKSKEYYLTGIHAKNSFRNFSRLFSKMSEEDCSASWCEHAILELGRCTKLCFYSLMYLHWSGTAEMTSLIAMYDDLSDSGVDVPEELVFGYDGTHLPKSNVGFRDFCIWKEEIEEQELPAQEILYEKKAAEVRECLALLDMYIALADSNSFMDFARLNYWGIRKITDFVGALLHFYGMTDKQLLPQEQYWQRSLGFFLETADLSDILIDYADISIMTNLVYLKYRAVIEDAVMDLIAPVVEEKWIRGLIDWEGTEKIEHDFSGNGALGLTCFLPESIVAKCLVEYSAYHNCAAGVLLNEVYSANKAGFYFLAGIFGETFGKSAKTHSDVGTKRIDVF